MRAALAYVLLVALGGCAEASASKPLEVKVGPTKPVVVEDDGHHLVDDMADAERLYEERHDPSAILAFFAPDAVIVASRSSVRSDKDTTMDKPTFSAVYIWASKFDVPMKFRYEDPRLAVDKDKATLEWRSYHDAGGPDQTFAFVQHYELERRKGQWTVVRYRYWPLQPATGEEYDFDALDAAVDESRRRHDDRNLARNLMLAYRFTESARVSRKLTEDYPEDAWCWDMRAKASAMVGDLEDAEHASEIAKQKRAGEPQRRD